MIIKDNVKANGIKTELLLGLIIADGVYKSLGKELVITELSGGKHSRGSLHYVGFGADLRTHFFNDNGKHAAKILKEKLGDEFDVVLELDHIHMEYQPKV